MDFKEFRQLEDETKNETERLQAKLDKAFIDLCSSLNLKVGEKIFFKNEYYFIQVLRMSHNFNLEHTEGSDFIWVTLVKPTKTGKCPLRGSTILRKSTEILRGGTEEGNKK